MKLFFLILTLVISGTAFGQWDVRQQNIKLPTQVVEDVYSTATAPVAASSTNVLSGATGDTDGTGKTYTSFSAQPDYPRNLVITPGGTTADVKAGSVVVTGKNALGKVITESFTFVDNQSTAVTGNKAFAKITSIAFPAEDSPYGATWSVGVGDKLGINRCLDGTGYLVKGLVDGVVLTGTTPATSSTAVESNTIIPNPAADGSRKFKFFFWQNYRCY